MEEGFIPQYLPKFTNRQAREVARWVAGPPVEHRMLGLDLPERQLPVCTFRCPKCGRLESFAL